MRLGYRPRIASERSDSGENRVDKICELVAESQYSVHDLSRLRADRAEEFYRLNMPFELGIDYGAREFAAHQAKKRCLILESGPYDFQKALSDLSGVDIKHHRDEPDEIVRAVRDWFYETVGETDAAYPKRLWYQFNDFTTDLYEARLDEGIPERDVAEDIERMPISEYLDAVQAWMPGH